MRRKRPLHHAGLLNKKTSSKCPVFLDQAGLCNGLRKIFGILALCVFFSAPFFYGQWTRHFHPGKLARALPSPMLSPELAVPSEEAPSCLNQPFFLTNHGSQSYILISEDGEWILKLFRYNRTQFRLLHHLKELLHGKKKAFLAEKLPLTLKAYFLAFTRVREETQLSYIHLERGGSLPTIPIVDHLGRTWSCDLSQLRFVLQKKGIPLDKALRQALKEDPAKAERMIDSFFSLLKMRTEQGISNTDPNLGPNFGFVGEKAFELDCGNYRENPSLQDPIERQKEIQKFADKLRPLHN